MNSLFHATFSWLSAVVVSFKNSLQIYLRKTWPMQAWIPVVCWSLYFWKSVFSFRPYSILKLDGDLYQTQSFLTACNFLWCITQTSRDRDNSRRVRNTRKEPRRNCSPIGHNNTKHFLCPIRSRHPLEFLETVRWESVPRSSIACTWKLSSRLFSRPDWLPMGLRGWHAVCYGVDYISRSKF